MRRSGLWLAVVVLLLLGAMAAKNLLVAAPPLRTANTPAQFDANRAIGRLAHILGDERAHPADSAASDGVRGRLIAQIRGLGLRPMVRDQLACNELYKARGVSCARVRNVIAVLGPTKGKAVLLNAHYDSTPTGPGAGDDGVGVATLLEVAAILKDRPLKRPVILLFNEGEELGLIGARAFLSDPLSRNVDILINLEARGVTGPANMFETSRPNGAAITAYEQAVDRPVANSLSTDVYRIMPNYTDVNSFAERSWTTLNLAIIGNETRYHSPGDTVAALDRASLQHMGDQTLALAQQLSAARAPTASGERIFMDVAGRTLVTLPFAIGGLMLAALLLGFGWLTIRRSDGLRSVSLILGALILSAALCWVVLALLGWVRSGIFWRAYPLWTHLAVYASTMLVALTLLATVGRPAKVRQLRAAFWLVFLVLGALIGIAAPGGIIFFLFPPLIVLAGSIGARWWKFAETAASIGAILLLFLTWGAMLGLLEELLNSGPMWIFAPLGALIVVPVLVEAKPLVPNVLTAATIGGIVALAAWGAAAAAPAYSNDRQQRFVIEHVTNAESGKAYWSVLNGGDPLPRSYAVLGRWMRDKLPYADQKRWLTDAGPVGGLKAPSLAVVSVVRNGKERAVTVQLTANGSERIGLVAPENAQITAAGVAGFVRPIAIWAADGRYLLSCSGRSCDGLRLTIVTTQPKPIDLMLVGTRSGLPSTAVPLVRARPHHARPQYAPDQTIVFAKARL